MATEPVAQAGRRDGDNGKTTTATLLYRLFRSLGYKVGLISTVTYCIDSERRESTHTTPDSVGSTG